MNVLRLPKKGEISSWNFFCTRGKVLTLNINLKGEPNALRKSLKQYIPPQAEIHFDGERDLWYIKGGNADSKSVAKVMNYIHSKLARGMNKEEWERAVPELFPDQKPLDVKEVMEQYLEGRKTGNRLLKKANLATLKGIKATKSAWEAYGLDFDCLFFRKGIAAEDLYEKKFYQIMYGFVEYLRESNKSVATQINYLFYLKDAMKTAAKSYSLAFPDLSEVSVGLNVKKTPVVIDNDATLKAIAMLDPMSFKSEVMQEAALVAKLMYCFGYRIGDAAGVTRKNFTQTDQGIFIKMYSQKHKVNTRHLVPDKLWEELQYFFSKWGGRVITSAYNIGSFDQRLRRNMKALVQTLPGAEDEIQVLRQRSDGSTYLEWTTLAKEFVPHIFRKTSGTQYHLLTGNGSQHLGNTQAVFDKHYLDRSAIDVDREREFHKRLGL